MTDRGVHILLYSQLLLKLKFKRSWDPGDTFSQHFTKAAAVYTGEAQMLRSTVTAPQPHCALIPAVQGQAPGQRNFPVQIQINLPALPT